jgi:uroporphyrinogen III methyltransferase/synthase
MTVYLVGAGPGDPGLLTVRGAEVLARADVVVFDRLSVSSLLDLAPPAAERIAVGKAPGRATMTQEDINALLVARGAAGQRVVRLKGGDPFVFARGGEEAAALQAAGVPFEVVPGITSAIAVPAYAGIPVTLRHSSTSFTVVTGHEDPAAGADGTVDWDAVARAGGTIVILMGVARIGYIAARLQAAGLAGSTPVASIQWGTRPEQRTVRATLATIAEAALEAPATIVVGEVAAQDLAWFERRPLFGRRVVVTRAREQAGDLIAALRDLGAEPVPLPVIEFRDPDDGGAGLTGAAASVAMYDWLVFTSANGVHRFFAHVPDTRALATARVAAIGPATAVALRGYRVIADLVPGRFVAESLLDAFPAPPADGGRVLLARAALARDVLPEGLVAAGWTVDVVDAYRTVSGSPTADQLHAATAADAIVFTSSSTVEHYVGLSGTERVPPVVACIGPVTAATARALGLTVTVESDVHTVPALVEALTAALARPEPP